MLDPLKMRRMASHPGTTNLPAMPTRLAVAMISLTALIAPQASGAQPRERTGKEVVDSVCGACHQTGAKGAPRIGDRKAWSRLASRGLASLTDSALKGIRKMPSHGGAPDLTDIEIERAITYMVNQSGGKWAEPVSGLTPAVERRGEQIVQAQCAKCHRTGVDGAPKIGDRDAWTPRLKHGVDFLVRSAINGHGPMPARGGVADLTDSELRGAIVYMFNPTAGAAKAAAPALPAPSGPNYRMVAGIEVFLGVVSAASIRDQYPKGSKESLMHGGIPTGRGYYHVNVSLFDAKTRAVITDAKVEASAREPVSGGDTKPLELVTLNNVVSYGSYFRMPGTNPYTITVKITRPGLPRPVEVKFEHKH
jgi:cytochrome c5